MSVRLLHFVTRYQQFILFIATQSTFAFIIGFILLRILLIQLIICISTLEVEQMWWSVALLKEVEFSKTVHNFPTFPIGEENFYFFWVSFLSLGLECIKMQIIYSVKWDNMSILMVFSATIFEQFPNIPNQCWINNNHCYELKKKKKIEYPALTLTIEQQKIIFESNMNLFGNLWV